MLNTAVAIVTIDVSKLLLLVVMLACLSIYCITCAMLNTAVAIVAIYVSKLSIPVISDACMLNKIIYCISSANANHCCCH